MANYEHMPAASQLAVLPFLAAVEGYLSEDGTVEGLEVTIHRAMNREGSQYLQQLTEYFPPSPNAKNSGRVFQVDHGIIGAAYRSKRIYKTRQFATEEQLLAEIDPNREPGKRAWCAVPFLGPNESVVLVLYARCNLLNFFSDERVTRVVSMAKGFCRLHDYLHDKPFRNLQNFPLDEGEPSIGGGEAYEVQDVYDIAPPRFEKLSSFNYEASAA